MNFAWSFKPLFILFIAIFGIDLNRIERKSKLRYCCVSFSFFFWFICYSIPLNVLLIIEGIKKDFSKISLITEINNTMNYIAPAILAFSFHVSLLVSSFSKWKPLWEKLQRFQDAIGNDQAFYRKLRHDAIIGTILIPVVNIFVL